MKRVGLQFFSNTL